MEIFGGDADVNPVFQFYAFPFLRKDEAQPHLDIFLNGDTQSSHSSMNRKDVLFENVFMNLKIKL